MNLSPNAPTSQRVVDPGASPSAAAAGEAAHDGVARTVPARASPVVVLLLADIASGLDRLWGHARFVLGPRALRGRVAGVRFAKVLGSGHEGGFGLRPSASRQGLFVLLEDAPSASAFLDRSPVAEAYRRHAREFCQLELHPVSSRGSWSGHAIQPGTVVPRGVGVAALTRASIRPSRAAEFWRHATPSQRALEHAEGCRLAVGLGEAPLLRQATFSLWDSTAAMEAYARSGAHLQAIRAAYRDEYFSETMFVRFVPVRVEGVWKGRRIG
jgi:hypothetical protein